MLQTLRHLLLPALLLISAAASAQEDPVPGTLAFSQADWSISETGGSITITVERSGGSDGEITVAYAAAGDTAASPEDFEARSGTLTFTDGTTSAGFTLDIVDTGIGSADKTVDLTLSNPTGGAALGENATAMLTIINAYDDFTASLAQIESSLETVEQPGVIDLDQASPYDSEQTLAELIQTLPVLQDGELEAEQDSNGVTSIDLQPDAYHFRPQRLVRSPSGSRQGVFLNSDGSGRFVLPTGITLHFAPALLALGDLQSALASVERPELSVSKQGVITVQINQGPPPLEVGDDGEAFINNRYYDRHAVRPSLYSLPAPSDVAPGIWTRGHPLLENEASLALVYPDGEENRYQRLNASPLDPDALEGALKQLGGTDIRFMDHGEISAQVGSNRESLVADFVVRRLEPGDNSPSRLYTTGDINGDGQADFRMVYSSGHEQYFYYFP